jgi:hypothetical protein
MLIIFPDDSLFNSSDSLGSTDPVTTNLLSSFDSCRINASTNSLGLAPGDITVGFGDEVDLNHPSFGRAIKKIITKTIEAVRSVFFTGNKFLMMFKWNFYKSQLVGYCTSIINGKKLF